MTAISSLRLPGLPEWNFRGSIAADEQATHRSPATGSAHLSNELGPRGALPISGYRFRSTAYLGLQFLAATRRRPTTFCPSPWLPTTNFVPPSRGTWPSNARRRAGEKQCNPGPGKGPFPIEYVGQWSQISCVVGN